MRGTEVPSLDRGGPESLSYPGYGNEWLDRPVIQRFEHCARQKPDAIAIRDSQGCLSYRELLSECWRIASYIDRETPPGSPIAIALPVDRHYPVAMLSALAAGRPYVPLDLSHPPERLRHILTHSGAEYVLTDTAQSTMVARWLPSTTKLLLRDIQHRTKISTGWLPPASAGDVAYIIYTSGSSGIPKGVYQNQRGLSHDVMQYTRSIHLRPDDILTGIYSPSVNGAIRDVFGALLNGATLLLFNLRSEGLGYVAEALKLHSATILHAMPPVMRSLLRALEGPTSLASVRMIYLAGDKLFSSDLLEIRKYLRPDASVYVGIGSTECATLYRQWFVPKDFTPSGPLVPSGRPVPDRIVEILEPGGKPVAPGETGQIVVSSPFIALGYWRDEIRTKAQFSGDPARVGWSRFATGDMASIGPDGLLMFEGRADRQVKIRGYRVEPAETEAALRGMPGVRDAAVVPVVSNSEARLVAFIVADAGIDLLGLQLNLRRTLPAHMCPAELRRIECLPLLSNFKVDASALEELAQKPMLLPVVQPATLHAVTKCWCEALKISEADENRSFSEEGGDSLKALEFHMALERELQRTIPLSKLGLDVSLKDIISWHLDLPQASSPLTSERRVQMFIFPPAKGVETNTLVLRDVMAEQMDVSVFDMPPEAKRRPYGVPIERIATQLFDGVLQRLRRDCRVVFVGQCCGSRVAHEIATRLQAQGSLIDLLVIADAARSADFVQGPKRGTIGRFRYRLRKIAFSYLSDRRLWQWKDAYESTAHPSFLVKKLGGWSDDTIRVRQSMKWKPNRLNAQSLLLLSAETLQRNPDVPRDLGWNANCSPLKVVPFGEGHMEYTEKPLGTTLRTLILSML